jgi:protein ImuB
MALHLPRLPTDRLRRAGKAPDAPFAVYAKIGNAFTLTAVDARAAQAGLTIGLPLADARAMLPHLAAFEADEAADARLIDDIAAWCERFTPVVVIDPPDGLFLDIAGSAHLFGGEASLRAEAVARLQAQGVTARAAIAPNPAAAWAFARFGQVLLVGEDGLRGALAPLPVAALRLAPDAAALLKRLGLRRIGQIMDAPRQPFAARAGQQAMLRLDQALGRARAALSPRRPPPPVYALRRLAAPILSLEAVLKVAEALSEDLCAKLETRGMGGLKLRLLLYGVDGRTRAIEIGLARPERDAASMLRLMRERLNAAGEALDAECGFEAARLDAAEIAPIVLSASDLAPASGRDAEAEARLGDMLAARLGAGAVSKLAVRDTHAPERATAPSSPHRQLASLADTSPASGGGKDGVMRRPLTLYHRAQPIEAIAEVPDGPPVRFRWRRVLREIVRAEGPERIAPNWLSAPNAHTRDYYRVEDSEGRRYWLYRDGLYGEAEAPRWFLHGLFA